MTDGPNTLWADDAAIVWGMKCAYRPSRLELLLAHAQTTQS